MKDKINKLIPEAIKVINKHMVENGEVKSEFKGYISSMGASIKQTGLLSTIAFFSNDENKKAKSSNLLTAINQLINPDNHKKQILMVYLIEECSMPAATNQSVGKADIDLDKLLLMEEEVEDALIALKLALRTFKLSES